MASPSTLHRSLELAGTLPALMVAADRVAATVIQGVHGRRRVGQGDAFWQYRPYREGDSASQIDWRQSARSRHLFVRETEWEAAASVWLWRDASPSMQYASLRNTDTKAVRGELINTRRGRIRVNSAVTRKPSAPARDLCDENANLCMGRMRSQVVPTHNSAVEWRSLRLTSPYAWCRKSRKMPDFRAGRASLLLRGRFSGLDGDARYAGSAANAECPAIPKMPQMPQGASASDEEMKMGREKLQAYVNLLQTFQKCMEDKVKNAPPDTKPEFKQQWQAEADLAVDNAHEIADIYSIQLRAFKARQ